MSKTAGSATSGYQTGSAASGARPAPAGRTSIGPARTEPEERVSRKESGHPGGDSRPNSAPEPDNHASADRPSAPGPENEASRDEHRPDSGPGDGNRSDAGQPADADELTDAEPADAEPADAEPAEAEAGDAEHGEAEAAEEAEPAEAEPGDAVPSDHALSEDEGQDQDDHAASASDEDEDRNEDEDEDHAEDRDSRPGPVPVIVESAHSYSGRDSTAGALPADENQPSWSRVIATTLRLWLQRRIPGRRDGDGRRRRAMGRRAGTFGVVILVFAAGALTIALAQGRISSGSHDSGSSPHHARAAKPGSSALRQAATNRKNAAAWVTAQVGSSVIVSCDPLMCTDLQASGFPVGNLMSLGVSATDPMGSQIIVSTTALRSQFGNRLPDVYAPVVVASFGSGTGRVDIRVDAPEGSQAYLVAQRADFLARQAAGKQLLRNKFLHVTGTSRQDIASGHVDSRLLITLAALTGQQHQVYVSRFGDGGPDQASAPLRMVRIAALIPHQPGKPHTYLTAVLKFFRTEQAPFRARTTLLHQTTKTLIQIQFAAPSPQGLLGANATP
jgi:hypothetical protein